MKTIILGKSDIGNGNLILVNAAHLLQNSEMGKLVPACANYPDILLRHIAASALQDALKAISARGKIVPVSGYRGAEEQTKIYNDSLRENGADFTKKFVALPGHSEHQTGLAIDLGIHSDHIDFIRPDFPYDGICEVFRETAPSYGFVERYPAGKESITGIAHEPWHFRYVGFPHSTIMTDNNLTLEEYVNFLKDYSLECPLVAHGSEIYYVPASGEMIEIHLPEKAAYQISGNNIDGFFVTIGRKTR